MCKYFINSLFPFALYIPKSSLSSFILPRPHSNISFLFFSFHWLPTTQWSSSSAVSPASPMLPPSIVFSVPKPSPRAIASRVGLNLSASLSLLWKSRGAVLSPKVTCRSTWGKRWSGSWWTQSCWTTRFLLACLINRLRSTGMTKKGCFIFRVTFWLLNGLWKRWDWGLTHVTSRTSSVLSPTTVFSIYKSEAGTKRGRWFLFSFPCLRVNIKEK